jgi:hypothetical protein
VRQPQEYVRGGTAKVLTLFSGSSSGALWLGSIRTTPPR